MFSLYLREQKQSLIALLSVLQQVLLVVDILEMLKKMCFGLFSLSKGFKSCLVFCIYIYICITLHH